MMRIRGLVFDFDGLILDTEGPEYATWRQVFGEYGCELTIEDWSAGIGTRRGFDPYHHLETLAGRPIARDELRPRVRQRLLALIAPEVVRPGVTEYLDDAARVGLRVGLASSADRDWVTGHLTRLGLLDRFRTIQTWEEGKRPKPAPDLYLAALEALNLSPHEAIALEDSPNGLAAAKAAGLYCVAVPSGPTATLDFSQADLIIPSLAALPLSDLLDHAAARRL
jgi:HAD superfamily hydrolase (TIGR01509 family)